MKFHIFVGLLYVLPLSYASAAALESSNQSIQAFFEKGNYAEVALLQVDTNISGQVQHQQNSTESDIQEFFNRQFSQSSTIHPSCIKTTTTSTNFCGVII
jgi:hypothetical protein